jgi:tRNA (guanine10-N2)-methyltransferase
VVGEDDLVLDPFVGSASLLIPPTHFGAICFGQDLDSRVLHGTGVGQVNKMSSYYKKNVKEIENCMPKIMLNF